MKIKDVVLGELLKKEIEKGNQAVIDDIRRKQKSIESLLLKVEDIEEIKNLQNEYKELNEIACKIYCDATGDFELSLLEKYDIKHARYSIKDALGNDKTK